MKKPEPQKLTDEKETLKSQAALELAKAILRTSVTRK